MFMWLIASNNRIEKFDSNGNYLTQWGSMAAATASFRIPKALRWTALGTLFTWLILATPD